MSKFYDEEYKWDFRKDAFLTCFTFQDAFIQREKPRGLLFHSDQGSQYTASDFGELLCRNGVTQSFSTPGAPYDNAPMESFFASLKAEEIYDTDTTDFRT